uniref:Uncharacterized protein n=1 Tax=Candidatus Kentrum sp. DK TaxID=2126562 RepID=A0A450RW69_9GAMM|nr:MAG: hypothetical protein BECKDK2373B_GA0170837_100530 [Candidatus Kentron sp. DK]
MLLINPTHKNLCITRRFYFDSFRNREINRMRIPKRQIQYSRFHLSSISDAYQLKLFLESLANTNNHIAQQGTRSPRKRFSTPPIGTHARSYSHDTSLKRYLHIRMDDMFKRTLFTLHRHCLPVNPHINTGRYNNGNFRYSGHT